MTFDGQPMRNGMSQRAKEIHRDPGGISGEASGAVEPEGSRSPLPALPEPYRVLGVKIHPVTLAQTIATLEELVETEGRYHVVTVNPEFVMTAQRHKEFLAVLNGATLVLPDGGGVVWAGRFFGQRVSERVTGVDVVERFAAASAGRRRRFFLLGAADGVAERVGKILEDKFPGIVIAGTYAGSPRPEDAGEILSRIREARPDVLLVAYGSPNQDLWIARHRAQLPVPVCIGVGGTFDFIAGVVPRAPAWMRAAGIEWLYRLMQQPSRWRRMRALPLFACRVVVSRISWRRRETDSVSGNIPIEEPR